jgi:hypothetical protein
VLFWPMPTLRLFGKWRESIGVRLVKSYCISKVGSESHMVYQSIGLRKFISQNQNGMESLAHVSLAFLPCQTAISLIRINKRAIGKTRRLCSESSPA